MTFEEARKILDKENCFCIINVAKPIEVIDFLPWEKTEVKMAISTMGEYGYRAEYVRYEDTENRLKKLKAKYDKEHSTKKNDTLKDYEKSKNDALHARKKEEPAQTTDKPINRTRLNDSANMFNDALLDEQAKKIKELEATIENREKEIDILNDTMSRRIKDIHDLKQTVKSDNAIIGQYEEKAKEQNGLIGKLQDKLAEADGNYKYTLEKYTTLQKKVKEMGKQIAHLNEVIGKKNAQIKDYKIACEEHDEQLKEYMKSDKKKDDMISGLKKVNEGLRHKLADAVISKVNENALKSAESALVYKDKVIDELKKKISDAAGILTGSDGLRIIWSESDPIEDFFKFVSEYGRTE